MKEARAMCFGTFDKLHPGHLSYFGQAKKYGDFLIAVVARDENVLKTKGKLPRENEKTRLNNVRKVKLVDKAILGQRRDKFRIVKKYQPDIICLGYDQRVDLKELKKNFFGRIVRLKPYREDKYKSSKLDN